MAKSKTTTPTATAANAAASLAADLRSEAQRLRDDASQRTATFQASGVDFGCDWASAAGHEPATKLAHVLDNAAAILEQQTA